MLGFAALLAMFFAVGGGLLDFVSSKASKNEDLRVLSTIGTAVATFFVVWLMDWLILFIGTPVFAGATFLAIVLPNLAATLVFFAIANGVTGRFSATIGISLLGIVGLVCALVFWNNWPLGNDSNIYGHQLKVVMEPLKAYPPTDDNHMVTVSDQTALYKCQQAEAQHIPGSTTPISSRYSLTGDTVLQSVNGHMYYVCPLKLTGSANNRADKYTIPGYIVADAEDPGAAAFPKLGFHMDYTPGAPFGHSMTRLIYGWDSNVFVDDLTLEVNDRWQPYYTASIDMLPVRWQQSVPVGFIAVNPQTGKVTRYPLNNVPSWVDRIYSGAMAKDMLNWWGEWGAVSWSVQGSGGRYKVDGDVTLVYTKDGPVWQALMIPQNADATQTSVSYIALMDTRDKTARFYAAPEGLTVQGTVSHAVASSSANLKKLDPATFLIHRIYGVDVWVMPLVPSGTAGGGAEPLLRGCWRYSTRQLTPMPVNSSSSANI